MQLRGDWAWYKEVFHFPSWSSDAICWRCAANKSDCDYREVDLKAAWRKRRYSAAQFWAKMRSDGVTPCCLFALPGLTLDMVTIDVLRAVDLGISQDIIGNVLWEFVNSPCCTSRNQTGRVNVTWLMLKSITNILRLLASCKT